ncbi:MAG: Unknown protein [uncultured Sulfurovum sp.]|uniref:Uncharacterized protein n=1 Tax=uncultured Sulfurovum sp. TaxID=269237 RepID=A0A6S6TX03_9BACT|nr:MAG: Unknown protein [uncultured Sulfurovum sp.]
MRAKKGEIDSINLGGENLEGFLIRHEHYSIEVVKSQSVFNPKVWKKTFNKSLTQNIVRACIIHTYLGLTLPLKTFSRSQKVQVLEFAGLYSYTECSKLLRVHLKELWSRLQHTKLTRLDIALDWEKIPYKVTKALKSNREPFKWLNSEYFKTPKEGKKNYYINIVAYDKALKENLPEPMERLEFSFGASFFKDMYLKDLPQAIEKMEKSIKKKIGVSVKINPLFSHA